METEHKITLLVATGSHRGTTVEERLKSLEKILLDRTNSYPRLFE